MSRSPLRVVDLTQPLDGSTVLWPGSRRVTAATQRAGVAGLAPRSA